MDLLLEKHRCILVELHRENVSIKQLVEYLDNLIKYLNKNISNRLDCYNLLTIISFDLTTIPHFGLFNYSKIVKHPFFILLSRTFEMLFTKLLKIWLSNEEKQCLNAISLLIVHLCSHKNDNLINFYIGNNETLNPKISKISPLISYEKIFFTKTFRSKFLLMFEEDLSINRIDAVDDLKYELAIRFLRLWMKLNSIDYEFILNGIIQCLKSKIYIELARNINLRQLFLNPKEQFYLYQCSKYLQKLFFNDQEKLSKLLCEHLVDQTEKIFQKQLSIACEGDFSLIKNEKSRGAKIQTITWHIELLNFFALTPLSRYYFIKKSYENSLSSDEQKTLVDQMIDIIKNESLIKSVQINRSFYHTDVSLISYSLVLLYNLIFEDKIFRYLKEKKLIDIIEKFTNANDKTIQFTSTTLITILQKEYIDRNNHPTTIARSYLFMIENTIDEISHTFHGIKLQGVLTNLEFVVQNDNVKEEIVNDDGLNLLGECSYREDLDIETIRYPALRIIETISFASKAQKKLIENEHLMDYFNELSQSNDQIQSSISKRILWIAENEEKFIIEQNKNQEEKSKRKEEDKIYFSNKEFDEKKATYQYIRGDYRWKIDKRPIMKKSDLLLNYSSSDRILAQKIEEQFKLTTLYEICLLEVNEKDDPESMASLIEDTSIVIIFCSNEYRNSNASRLEAIFTDKRKKDFIGLKTDKQYEINGWLKEFFRNKSLIDFTKNDFQSSIKQLENEITKINNNQNKIK